MWCRSGRLASVLVLRLAPGWWCGLCTMRSRCVFRVRRRARYAALFSARAVRTSARAQVVLACFDSPGTCVVRAAARVPTVLAPGAPGRWPMRHAIICMPRVPGDGCFARKRSAAKRNRRTTWRRERKTRCRGGWLVRTERAVSRKTQNAESPKESGKRNAENEAPDARHPTRVPDADQTRNGPPTAHVTRH